MPHPHPAPAPAPKTLRLRIAGLAVFVGGCLFALLAGAAPADAAAALAALADRYYEAQARLDPVYSATLIGDNRFDDQLPVTIAPAQRRARFALYREVQRELAAIPRERLSAADALTHELLADELQRRLGFEAFDDHLLPLQQLDSLPLQLANFGGGQAEQSINTVAQYEAYLRRIEGLPAWIEQALVNLREGMRRGIVQPRAVMEATLTRVRAIADAPTEQSPFYAPIRNLPAAFAPADRERLTGAYREAVAQRVAPAMRRLADFVQTDYLPACRASAGWGALPGGAAWYRQWVRDQTTTTLSPEEIHAIGLKEVARIHGRLARLAQRLGHAGDPQQLLAWVRTQPKFRPFRSEAEVLDTYKALNQRVMAQLPRLFGRMPKAALDVRPVPELQRATASDYYALPAEDGSRPGIFWAVVNDPADYDSTAMTSLFLHEGQPGHHFQMALQQEMALPPFRKRMWINAYGEGWGLYAETLGDEMGLYADAAAQAGFLRLEMARAARLVVDTGLHAKGWSREEAVAYWKLNVGVSEAQAVNQVQRYMAWPAQALGYKLGSLKIQQLREQARQQLGPRFKLAAFHDAVLAEGSLTLPLLQAQIERWIASQR